jgi:hypothetical protein
MNKFLSRKWLIALFFTITGCAVFAFTGKLTGGEFVSLALGLTGLFGASDAALNYIHRDKSNPDAPKGT